MKCDGNVKEEEIKFTYYLSTDLLKFTMFSLAHLYDCFIMLSSVFHTFQLKKVYAVPTFKEFKTNL